MTLQKISNFIMVLAGALLIAAVVGIYQWDFLILRWAVFLTGIIFANLAYRSKQIPWLCTFVAVAVVFNPILPLSLNDMTTWRVVDAITLFLFGFFFWRYYDRYGKGHRFEDYVATLFPAHHWVVVDRTRDFSKALGRFVESDTNPDFMFRNVKTGKAFAVECKFRSYLYKGGISWDRQKGERYHAYGIKHNVPVFVAIGLGGNPKKPERLFMCPLEKLNNFANPVVPMEEFVRFERDSKKQFASIEEILK
ncbi:MAG: hypothetical protein Q8P88_00805 [Candidatus Jorgensenbacteria bacterium]|nr:hypothetical protein [Candidatus Jorgensenbacteria bacterium]